MASSILAPRPAEDVDILQLRFPAGNGIPNNPRHPAVLARNALGGTRDDGAVRALMEANGWSGTWTWRVFDYDHYHHDAFETLAVASGGATLQLGGPQGEHVDVKAGDVVLLPPGFGHRQIAMRDGFRICGAYPPGQESPTVLRAEQGYAQDTLRRIAAVEPPTADPVWGGHGPLLKALLE